VKISLIWVCAARINKNIEIQLAQKRAFHARRIIGSKFKKLIFNNALLFLNKIWSDYLVAKFNSDFYVK
jgi:hypothetical protein